MSQQADPYKLQNLPPELARQVNLTPAGRAQLTPKEQRRDQAYRDKMLALSQTAARLSADEERLAHAHVRAFNYKQEASRLHQVLAAKRLPKGVRAQTKKSLKATGENLAEALYDCGLFWEALACVVAYSPRSHLRGQINRVMEAIERPDGEHCPCPATDKHEVKRLYIPERGRFVPLISCACGHLNASEQPPADFEALRRAKADAPEGGHDEWVIARAKQSSNL